MIRDEFEMAMSESPYDIAIIDFGFSRFFRSALTATNRADLTLILRKALCVRSEVSGVLLLIKQCHEILFVLSLRCLLSAI